MLRRLVAGKAAVAMVREAAPREAARDAACSLVPKSCRDASARRRFSHVLVPRVRPSGRAAASSLASGATACNGQVLCGRATDGFFNSAIHVKPGQQAFNGKDPVHLAMRSGWKSGTCWRERMVMACRLAHLKSSGAAKATEQPELRKVFPGHKNTSDHPRANKLQMRMSRAGRSSPSWRARPSEAASRGQSGFTPRTSLTSSPAGCAPSLTFIGCR